MKFRMLTLTVVLGILIVHYAHASAPTWSDSQTWEEKRSPHEASERSILRHRFREVYQRYQKELILSQAELENETKKLQRLERQQGLTEDKLKSLGTRLSRQLEMRNRTKCQGVLLKKLRVQLENKEKELEGYPVKIQEIKEYIEDLKEEVYYWGRDMQELTSSKKIFDAGRNLSKMRSITKGLLEKGESFENKLVMLTKFFNRIETTYPRTRFEKVWNRLPSARTLVLGCVAALAVWSTPTVQGLTLNTPQGDQFFDEDGSIADGQICYDNIHYPSINITGASGTISCDLQSARCDSGEFVAGGTTLGTVLQGGCRHRISGTETQLNSLLATPVCHQLSKDFDGNFFAILECQDNVESKIASWTHRALPHNDPPSTVNNGITILNGQNVIPITEQNWKAFDPDSTDLTASVCTNATLPPNQDIQPELTGNPGVAVQSVTAAQVKAREVRAQVTGDNPQLALQWCDDQGACDLCRQVKIDDRRVQKSFLVKLWESTYTKIGLAAAGVAVPITVRIVGGVVKSNSDKESRKNYPFEREVRHLLDLGYSNFEADASKPFLTAMDKVITELNALLPEGEEIRILYSPIRLKWAQYVADAMLGYKAILELEQDECCANKCSPWRRKYHLNAEALEKHAKTIAGQAQKFEQAADQFDVIVEDD